MVLVVMRATFALWYGESSRGRAISLESTTLLAGDGGRILCGDPFNLSAVRCFAVALVAGYHSVLIQRVQIASAARTIPPH